MKYNIIANLFVFLFLACNPDFNTNKKDIGYQSSKKGLKSNKKRLKSNKKGLTPKTKTKPNQEEISNQEASSKKNEEINNQKENTLLDDLRNLIEKAKADKDKYVQKLKEESSNQYGILAFKELFWLDGTSEQLSANTERSKAYRKRTYSILNAIDNDALKNFSDIVMASGQTQGIFNNLNSLGSIFEEIVDFLHPKKDNLEKLEISALKRLKNSLENFLETKKIASEMLYKFLLDYKNNTNRIQTDVNELKSHANTLFNQLTKKIEEAEKLKNDICSTESL
ncbi:borrelia burgdorferi virulent strain associated lipofamily protein (plasmid) [Borreliella bissettiae DN127]|uniref:Borrelia burgdorferi virulent strain associated lipofamily protein n=1 Tax=Borrelia bissettiae (strain DSM 17990 / CIP 109136 / DN127) TaxID=521010 RepID=G0AP84_BORBD|nr:virulence associated lipoprotein [Borreliella bissettiae]AEL19510.1 borrelia burgdorferi virulent strain associated lipofamily protein [Borreliella bissettiae DN127]